MMEERCRIEISRTGDFDGGPSFCLSLEFDELEELLMQAVQRVPIARRTQWVATLVREIMEEETASIDGEEELMAALQRAAAALEHHWAEWDHRVEARAKA